MKNIAREILREILLILGFLSLVYGVGLIHVPVAFILGGVVLVYLTMPSAKKGGK